MPRSLSTTSSNPPPQSTSVRLSEGRLRATASPERPPPTFISLSVGVPALRLSAERMASAKQQVRLMSDISPQKYITHFHHDTMAEIPKVFGRITPASPAFLISCRETKVGLVHCAARGGHLGIVLLLG